MDNSRGFSLLTQSLHFSSTGFRLNNLTPAAPSLSRTLSFFSYRLSLALSLSLSLSFSLSLSLSLLSSSADTGSFTLNHVNMITPPFDECKTGQRRAVLINEDSRPVHNSGSSSSRPGPQITSQWILITANQAAVSFGDKMKSPTVDFEVQ